MTVFKTPNEKMEVIGDGISVIVNGMGAFKTTALKILAENGIKDLDPKKWYKSQDFLNAFKSIYEKIGEKTLKVIGLTVPTTAQIPPVIDNIEKALRAIDVAFHMIHRKGNPGGYSLEMTGKNKGIMTCEQAYPCAFDEGLILGFMNKFRAEGSIPNLAHLPGACRMRGAEYCKYELSW